MSKDKMKELHIFLLQHRNGEEGLAAFSTGEDYVPMVAGDDARLEKLQGMAQSLADTHGVPIVHATFAPREDVQTYVPRAIN
jgi:hypothetical protein